MKQPSEAVPSRARAVLLLSLVALAFVAALFSLRPSAPTQVATAAGDDDVSMYTEIVKRLSAGEPYYDVLGAELRQRGYPTLPFFNWRQPLLFSAVAVSPGIARAVLITLGLLVLAATVTQLASESPTVVLGGAIAQAGALPITLVPGSVVLHEVWTGVLVALSVCLYQRRWWIPAALTGLSALFVRELAAPYCVVAVLLAIRARRWNELIVWAVGGAGYAVYLGLHVRAVLAHGQPGDLHHLESWIQWGGLPFILATLRWNGWLTVAPPWITAAAFAVLVAGVFDRTLSPHLRFAVIAYVALFAIAGHDFNSYWGVIPMLTYPLLFGYGLRNVGRLARQVSLQTA